MLNNQTNIDLLLANSYIERCDKESEQFISKEDAAFFKKPIEYLKKQKNEFLYFESERLESIGVDAISLEADDVFGTYDVMLGLKLQKKVEKNLREQLDRHLSGEEPKFDLLFNHQDGLWDLNFTLNYLDGFTDKMSLEEAFILIDHFLFDLVGHIKSKEE